MPFQSKDIKADPQARDELVNKYKSKVTATLVINEEVIRGFQASRKQVEEALTSA